MGARDSGRPAPGAPGRPVRERGETLREVPALEGEEVPDARVPGRRVTLDFRGPPLALPGESPEETGSAWARPSADESPCGREAIGLVDRSRASLPARDLASEMRERYALDDFSGALRAAELLLGREPSHAEAQRYVETSRQRLEQLYSSRLGGLRAVPVVRVGASEVRWLGIDHRAGFLLSRIDGIATVEDILDVCGMPRLEALKLLSELVQAGAIGLEAG